MTLFLNTVDISLKEIMLMYDILLISISLKKWSTSQFHHPIVAGIRPLCTNRLAGQRRQLLLDWGGMHLGWGQGKGGCYRIFQTFPWGKRHLEILWIPVKTCKNPSFAAFCRLGRVEIWHFQTLQKTRCFLQVPSVKLSNDRWFETTTGEKLFEVTKAGFSQRDSPHHPFKLIRW